LRERGSDRWDVFEPITIEELDDNPIRLNRQIDWAIPHDNLVRYRIRYGRTWAQAGRFLPDSSRVIPKDIAVRKPQFETELREIEIIQA